MRNPTRLFARDAVQASWTMPAPIKHTARSFAEALFLTDQGPPPEQRVDWLLDELEDFLAHAGVRAQLIFLASMTALLTLAPLSDGKPVPLTSLDPEARAHAIERFEATPLGIAVLGAKAMLCLLWYEHPDVCEDVGITQQCLVDP